MGNSSEALAFGQALVQQNLRQQPVHWCVIIRQEHQIFLPDSVDHGAARHPDPRTAEAMRGRHAGRLRRGVRSKQDPGCSGLQRLDAFAVQPQLDMIESGAECHGKRKHETRLSQGIDDIQNIDAAGVQTLCNTGCKFIGHQMLRDRYVVKRVPENEMYR